MSKILIIDDEHALRVGLAAIVKRHGYEVVTASDGLEGMQLAKELLPDLILSDVMMPPPNGFELRKLLSQDVQLASIPFIFLTARTGVEDRILGMREGADDYIVKPFAPDELLARIEAVLRRVEVEQARGRDQALEIAERNMDKLKREILQNFQHELRTPLSNVTMSLELAVKNKFASPEEQVSFMRTALSGVDRLESLVTDFILLTNMDHGDLNQIRQTVSIESRIVQPVMKMMERYRSKNINLIQDIDQHGTITAPRLELTHAVLHLVNNALKFSPEGGIVILKIKPGKNGGAVISVHDDGPGIPPEFREKVFERYYQISQGDNRMHEGLGVGLTVARAIFENIGGSVSILDVSSGCTVQAVIPDHRPEDIVYG